MTIEMWIYRQYANGSMWTWTALSQEIWSESIPGGVWFMSLNATPSSERFHIGFFGSMNSGKSSIVNAVTGQDLSVVSDVKGTTTDPGL